MKGYDNYSSEIFETKDSPEVLKWETLFEREISKEKVDQGGNVNTKFKELFNFRAKKYEVKMIPRTHKRNNYDNAKLLLMYLVDGRVMGKRFNNNQILRLP